MAFLHEWLSALPTSTWIGLVALIGYLVGRHRRRELGRARSRDRLEIARAMSVSHEMEATANRLLGSLATHLPAVDKFSARLNRLEKSDEASWDELCERADELLKPVLQLSCEISRAYAELVQQMGHLSTFADMRTDPLTGVANRRAFDESLAGLVKQHNRYSVPVTLAMLDIDRFKQINDERGHLQGDRVLQELAAILKDCARDCDVVARYGGEEFVVLMPYTELHAACTLTERIREAMETQLHITVSMGVAAAQLGDSPELIIARADEALYAAKGAGRNCVYLHEGMPGRIVGIKIQPTKLAEIAEQPVLAAPLAVSQEVQAMQPELA